MSLEHSQNRHLATHHGRRLQRQRPVLHVVHEVGICKQSARDHVHRHVGAQRLIRPYVPRRPVGGPDLVVPVQQRGGAGVELEGKRVGVLNGYVRGDGQVFSYIEIVEVDGVESHCRIPDLEHSEGQDDDHDGDDG